MSLVSITFLLPILFFLTLVLHGTAAWSDPAGKRDWRYAFLVSALVWGAVVALGTEVLSLLGAVSRGGIALLWLLALGALVWRIGGLSSLAAGYERLRRRLTGLDLWQHITLAGLAGLSGMLLAVGWVSPPNNVDSLLYHMSRVAHWAQNGSLGHYPAVFHHQLNMPPFAEVAILHLRALFGDDRPAALVQWFAMLGSLVGVSYIANRLGAGSAGQALAAVFAATLPMGILQATSTQNDYVVAFWLVLCLVFFLDAFEPEVSWGTDAGVGAAAGLGLLTKATFYIYGLPVVVGFLILRLRRWGLKRALLAGAIVTIVVFALNVGYWGRNMRTFDAPLGGVPSIRESLLGAGLSNRPAESAGADAAEAGDGPIVAERGAPGSTGSSLAQRDCCRTTASAVLRAGIGDDVLGYFGAMLRRIAPDILLHTVTPSSAVNGIIEDVLRQFPWLLKADYFVERDAAAWNHEDTAGNPLHLGALTIALPLLLVKGRATARWRKAFGFLTVVLAGFLLLTSFFGAPRIYELRYHLAFFVVSAPLAGLALEPIFAQRARYLIPLGLGLALPWLLLNNMRPVVGLPPWPTRTESVFSTPKQEILLAIAPHAVDDYSAAAGRIEDAECRNVGLAIGQQDLEYAFWWLLDSPQSGVRLEVINPSPATARYADPDFEPCAVLCTRCGAVQSQLDLMHHTGSYANFDLYLMQTGD